MAQQPVPPVPAVPQEPQPPGGIRSLALVTDQLRSLIPARVRIESNRALEGEMQNLSTVKDASRELFVRHVVDSYEEVDERRKAAARGVRDKRVQQFAREYRIGEVLGRGTFGVAIAGKSRDDDREVAIKLMKKEDVRQRGRDYVARVLLERHLLAAVRAHPYVLEFVQALHTRSHLLLVAELAPCGDLRTWLGAQACEWRLQEDVARFYAAQIVCALISIQ